MKSFFKFFAFTFITLVFLVNVVPVHAQSTCIPGPDGYCPLTALPGISKDATTPNVNINTYIPGVIKLIIGIAGALAVLRIMMGGIKYMTSDAFESKSDAKETINNALIGLLLAISAYIILYTLNPNLVTFQFNIAGLRVGAPISTNMGTTTPGEDTLGGNITLSCQTSKGVVPCTCINCVNVAKDPTLTFKNNSTMNALLFQALKIVRSNTKMSWQITEAWPPTSPHSGLCHTNGTCVDINLIGSKYVSGSPTKYQVEDINTLAAALRAANLGVIYEVNRANYNILKGFGVDPSILVDTSSSSAYDNNTDPSFHVNIH